MLSIAASRLSTSQNGANLAVVDKVVASPARPIRLPAAAKESGHIAPLPQMQIDRRGQGLLSNTLGPWDVSPNSQVEFQEPWKRLWTQCSQQL